MAKAKAKFSGSEYLAKLFPLLEPEALKYLDTVVQITVWSSGFYAACPFTGKKAFFTTTTPPESLYANWAADFSSTKFHKARTEVTNAIKYTTGVGYTKLYDHAQGLAKAKKASLELAKVSTVEVWQKNMVGLLQSNLPDATFTITETTPSKSFLVAITPPLPLPQAKWLWGIPAEVFGGSAPTPASTTPAPSKPVPGKSAVGLELKHAKALGEGVKGTSTDVVYRVIALGAACNIAARVHGQNLSVRVEAPAGKTLSPLVTGALTSLKFENKDGYSSNHYVLNGIPPYRVIGAILSSIDTTFTARVLNPAQTINALSGKVDVKAQ
jgi:hypothetical protein